MGPLKHMGGGQGGDLSVSFDLLSLVSMGVGSSGVGPLGGQCATKRSEAAPCFGGVRPPDGDYYAFADSSWAQAHVPGPYVRPWGTQ